ncbi:hypothetical protein GOP47_0009601 [Adiantum capillus-veneris]|uniref:RING-type domain-containing protein n=1 Tax=Adiantum capillus-veneris TaxID=13818 RepID=A0A9D4UWJ3_ADICA|nr:hypothetical protein GOP47_0009601 [Adiantum capillus-veneris]
MERSSVDGDELSKEILVNEVIEAVLEDGSSSQRTSSRQPFTSLSQVDADLALARALQQQEHAYLLLHMSADGSEYDQLGSGSFDYDYAHDEEVEEQDEVDELPCVQPHEDDEDSVEAQVGEIDGSLYENDEAFARALQEAEHRDATVYMMGLVGVEESDGEDEDQSNQSQDAWQDVDPDNMSYEELVALGEAVGSHSRGLKPDVIAALPYSQYAQDDHSCTSFEDPCVICRFEYEEGDCLSTLPCKHHYHTECIKNWLQINKSCPICSAEVPS